jgi:hypothetical protein
MGDAPADTNVYAVELPPAFHDLRLNTEHRATTAATAASCSPTAGALKANASSPETAAIAPYGMVMQKSCSTACPAWLLPPPPLPCDNEEQG